jgi:DNA-binding transcriptional MerR regulator
MEESGSELDRVGQASPELDGAAPEEEARGETSAAPVNKRAAPPGSSRSKKRDRRSSAAHERGVHGPLDLGTDKLYFKIGEVADIVAAPAYVLRYWESEFKAIKPQKSRAQQRVYRRRDVETLLRIKHLLYTRKFTIAGARQQLREAGAELAMAPVAGAYLARQSFAAVRTAIDDLEREISTRHDAETGADPAAYLREMGGALALVSDTAGQRGGSQPMLRRQRAGKRG